MLHAQNSAGSQKHKIDSDAFQRAGTSSAAGFIIVICWKMCWDFSSAEHRIIKKNKNFGDYSITVKPLIDMMPSALTKKAGRQVSGPITPAYFSLFPVWAIQLAYFKILSKEKNREDFSHSNVSQRQSCSGLIISLTGKMISILWLNTIHGLVKHVASAEKQC